MKVRGLQIEISGDTTKLESSLRSVNSEIKNTESKLKDVNKLLKMDPGNTNLLSQKYKTLQQEIKATKDKLDTLKEAGPEAVVGVSSLMDMIQSAVNNNMPMADTGNITIPVYIGGNLIDEMIVTAQQRRALRSGGRA